MSLPPQIIHVKRKRTEEGPVPSFLRVEATIKRHRSDAFLYRRHDPEAAAAAAALKLSDAAAESKSPRPPKIHTSKPGEERGRALTDASTAAAAVSAQPSKPSGQPAIVITATTTATTATATIATGGTVAMEPRRFHLSRNSLLLSTAAPAASALNIGGIRKRTRYGRNGAAVGGVAETAVFVERSQKKQRKAHRRQQLAESVPARLVPPATAAAAPPAVAMPRLPKRPSWRGPVQRSASSSQAPPPAAGAEATGDSTLLAGSAPALPGSTSGSEASQAPPPPPAAAAPLPTWNFDMDKLTREMNAYTLEVIGQNLARIGPQKQPTGEAPAAATDMLRASAESRRSANAKLRPKPTARDIERQKAHQASSDADATALETSQVLQDGVGVVGDHSGDGNNNNTSNSDGDESSSESDDDDYVTETYVRVPGHEARKAVGDAEEAAASGNLGLLVFDHEPDMEFFYGAEEDSEEEFPDDEDENAENYYTHDYPEDEVSSDDEFDRAPYHYRTNSASDMEEFDDVGSQDGGL